jgi:hypothetical protein
MSRRYGRERHLHPAPPGCGFAPRRCHIRPCHAGCGCRQSAPETAQVPAAFFTSKTGPQPVECAVQRSAQVGQGGNLVVFVLYQGQCLRQQGLVFSSWFRPEWSNVQPCLALMCNSRPSA